jgi:hypothetical protein
MAIGLDRIIGTYSPTIPEKKKFERKWDEDYTEYFTISDLVSTVEAGEGVTSTAASTLAWYNDSNALDEVEEVTLDNNGNMASTVDISAENFIATSNVEAAKFIGDLDGHDWTTNAPAGVVGEILISTSAIYVCITAGTTGVIDAPGVAVWKTAALGTVS